MTYFIVLSYKKFSISISHDQKIQQLLAVELNLKKKYPTCLITSEYTKKSLRLEIKKGNFYKVNSIASNWTISHPIA